MFHPTRGGTRGGKDQFKWEDVKDDKYREYYLGHSLMAPVGRWQQGKDLTWYAKDKKDDKQIKAEKSEIERIKEAEAEAMAIALGVRKKKKLESNVTEDDLKHALIKNDDESEDDERRVDTTEKGLGYGKRLPLMQQVMSDNVEVLNRSSGGSYSQQQIAHSENTAEQRSMREHDDRDEYESSKKHKDKKSKKHHKDKSDRKKKKHRSHRHHSDDSDVEDKRRSRHHHSRHHRDRSHDRQSSDRHRRRDEDHDRSRHHEHSSSRRDDRYRVDDNSKYRHYQRGRSRSASPRRQRHSYSRSRSPPRLPPSPKDRSLSPYSKRAALSKR